jgi:hypothetical protein
LVGREVWEWERGMVLMVVLMVVVVVLMVVVVVVVVFIHASGSCPKMPPLQSCAL